MLWVLQLLSTRNSEESGDLVIQPNILLPYATNVSYVGDYSQNNVTLDTVWADPGIEASLTNSWERSATFSSSTGITGTELSMALNFTIGEKYTVSYTGKYTAPSTYGGREVDLVKLYAHPVREKYTFDVYEPTKQSWNPFADPYEYTGTGSAYKPIGVYYQKIYVYK